MYPPFTTNHYLADFVVVTLQSARCTHTVVSGSVVLFTHCTLDAITHVIIALEQSARYIYIHYMNTKYNTTPMNHIILYISHANQQM